MPRRLASASASTLVVPQSTVTSSVAPFAASPHRFDVGAIAFKDTVRNVDQRIEPAVPQMPGEQRRRGRAVDIIVAEDRHLLLAHGGIGDPRRCRFHLRHGVRIRHQLADRRVEKILDGIDLDAAPRQHPRQHFGQLVALHDSQRAGRTTRIEAIEPDASGCRFRNAEESGWHFDRQCGCGRRHGVQHISIAFRASMICKPTRAVSIRVGRPDR